MPGIQPAKNTLLEDFFIFCLPGGAIATTNLRSEKIQMQIPAKFLEKEKNGDVNF
jgi:hypothetical protein